MAPMCYVYTSGTTGLPKAAIISNQRWLEAGLVLGRLVGEMTHEDVLYLTLPLYHSTGFLAAWGAVLMSGATLALRRKFSATHFWEDVLAFDATLFIYIGELCRYLLSQPPTPSERQHHLRLCMGNGLRADIWRRFQSRFRIPLIREYYGATEGNLGLVNLEGRPGMIGRLLPGAAIVQCDPLTGEIIRNRAGRCESIAVGERGLLLGRINLLTSFDGYLDRAATRKKIVRDVFRKGDAYFNTGDVVELHADRWVSFADRVGDTFRWKGENVSTYEVAEILSHAKGLQEANVYGVPVNGAEGRVGMASVVVTPGFDLNAFARYVVNNLASYQRPYFLRVVPDMRVTGTFKHQKHEYRNEGYDPSRVKDPLYYLDGRQYVPIDDGLYDRLAAGEIGPR
jgi:acyl-CoA synthetase (AMP-forming)/AMP-acid ligase II